jgi:hypothetical protein
MRRPLTNKHAGACFFRHSHTTPSQAFHIHFRHWPYSRSICHRWRATGWNDPEFGFVRPDRHTFRCADHHSTIQRAAAVSSLTERQGRGSLRACRASIVNAFPPQSPGFSTLGACFASSYNPPVDLQSGATTIGAASITASAIDRTFFHAPRSPLVLMM